MSWPYFIWKGTHSTEMDVIVTDYPPITKPKERVLQATVPGRQGDLLISEIEGEPMYEPYLRTVTCHLQPNADIRVVCNWLTGSGTVIFGNEPDRVYTARIINQISFDKILRGRGHRSFSVPFYCQPLKAQTPPEGVVTLTASGQQIWNPGDVIARPKYTVYGSDSGSFVSAGRSDVCSLVFGEDTALVIDSEAMMCMNLSGDNRNSRMLQEFPLLNPGWNTITWVNGITRIDIEGRWRWL